MLCRRGPIVFGVTLTKNVTRGPDRQRKPTPGHKRGVEMAIRERKGLPEGVWSEVFTLGCRDTL